MKNNYLYIDFGQAVDPFEVYDLVKKYLFYEEILIQGEDFVLMTYDISDGSTGEAMMRHVQLTDDDWVLSASYHILKSMHCEDTGFVITGEPYHVSDNKITFMDAVFKFSTRLIFNFTDEESINFIREHIRSDVKILSTQSEVIYGVPSTVFNLDTPILTQILDGDISEYMQKIKNLIK